MTLMTCWSALLTGTYRDYRDYSLSLVHFLLEHKFLVFTLNTGELNLTFCKLLNAHVQLFSVSVLFAKVAFL